MKNLKITIYKSRKNGQFSWRIQSRNGKKIACAGETFHNKKDCIKSMNKLINCIVYTQYEIIDSTK